MNSLKLLRNPYILFSPFLLFFVVIVIKLRTDFLIADENRYFQFALNLLQGFYSPPPPNINLWNGPGYPIILAIFIALHLPVIYITLANAVFQYLSIIFLFKTIEQFTSFRTTVLFSFFWAFYYIAYEQLPRLYTESFTLFLFSALILFLTKSFNKPSKKYIYLSGFLLGFLALTKVILGYVMLIMLLAIIILWIANRNSANYKKSAFILLIAFFVTFPYLFYTYNLTGRFFYWSNASGQCLYWLSTPYEGEFGEWNSDAYTANCGNDPVILCNAELLRQHHQKDFAEIDKYVGVERDDVMKKIAFRNIKEYPVKFLKNWVANVSRLLFGIPASYFYQRLQTLLRILPNAILLTFMIFCLIPTILNWKNLDYSLRFILMLLFFYLSASSFACAFPRQFYVIVPLLLFWISFITERSLKLNLRFKKD
jgi:hypothetical protein